MMNVSRFVKQDAAAGVDEITKAFKLYRVGRVAIVSDVTVLL